MRQPSLFDPPKRKPPARKVSADLVRRMAVLAEASEFLEVRVGWRRKLPDDQRRMAARLVCEVERLVERLEAEGN